MTPRPEPELSEAPDPPPLMLEPASDQPRDPHSPHQRDRRGLFAGRFVLLVLGLVVIAVMVSGWMVLRFSTAVMDERPALSWAERADWPQRPVRETTLAASGVQRLFTGAEWRELSLSVPEAEERAVAELAELARSEAFTQDATRDRIEQLLAEQPELFYASYLLATWHRVHGNDAEAEAHYQRAFAEAPGALRQPFVTPHYQGLSHLEVGSIEIVCYRATAGEVDDTLRLVFPELETDANGHIAVPVYKSVLRIAERDEPAGLEARHADPEHFQFPGRIGTLPAAMVADRP